MNKVILGSILASISLLVIYGASAANRITSQLDRVGQRSAQTTTGQVFNTDTNNPESNTLVAINPAEEDTDNSSVNSNDTAATDSGSQPTLEKAGDIPQRQTIGSTPNFGTSPTSTDGADEDDTGGEVVQPAPSTPTPPTDTAGNNTPTTPAPTPNETPIRALW